MEQVAFNNIQDTKFSNYFTDIENLRKEDLPNINTLIKKYPYCQALHLLAARSAVNTPLYEKTLTNSAVSVPSRNILYNFIHQPAKFKTHPIKKTAVVKDIPETDTLISIIDAALNNEEKYTCENEVFDEIKPSVAPEETLISIHQQPVFEHIEIENLSLDGEKYSETLIVQETADEPLAFTVLSGEEAEDSNTDVLVEKTNPQMDEELLNIDEEQQVISEENTPEPVLPYIENIQEEEDKTDLNESTFIQENFPVKQEPINLSRYNDERLPYTFLWWLAKTRKTYQENLRPYASFSLDTTQEIKKNIPDSLDHQIAENIFHINSLSDIQNKEEAISTVPFDFMKKEHQIIEKFIKEEPQIKPPVANKIDTENKAKKSSEDSNELVSETLAKVYVEQMLFHKALDVYRKLSLKYPEKSAYFASQIKYLELKVN